MHSWSLARKVQKLHYFSGRQDSCPKSRVTLRAMSPQNLQPTKPEPKSPETSLATRTQESAYATAKRYYNELDRQAVNDTRKFLKKKQLIMAMVTGLAVAVIQGTLESEKVFSWKTLIAIPVVYCGTILLAYVINLFRAAVRLDSKRQYRINELGTKIDGLEAGHKSQLRELDERRKSEVREAQQERNKVRAELNDRIEELERSIQEDNNRIREAASKSADMYKDLQATKFELSKAKEERGIFWAELEERDRHKLILEVDTELYMDGFQPRRSGVIINYDNTRYIVKPFFRVRFWNNASHKLTTRSVKVFLMRKTAEGEEEVPSLNSHLDNQAEEGGVRRRFDLDNFTLEGGTPSEYIELLCDFELTAEQAKQLDKDCFLRISMEAMNQKVLNRDFGADWEGAYTDSVPLTPRN
jgi:hypothetical protein